MCLLLSDRWVYPREQINSLVFVYNGSQTVIDVYREVILDDQTFAFVDSSLPGENVYKLR